MRRSFLAAERAASCALARVEVVRLARTRGSAAFEQARRVVEELYLVRLDDAVLDAAAVLPVSGVRSLDAIHLAAALSLRESGLSTLVTYDERMASAARELGLEVVSPR